MFNQMFQPMLGPPAPTSLICRMLGLSELPATAEAVVSAFRARVAEIHPDTAGEDSDPDRVAELLWARDMALLRLVRPPVTASNGPRDPLLYPSRPHITTCAVCGVAAGTQPDGRRVRIYGAAGGLRKRWVGYCWACATDAENEHQRDLRRERRANMTCECCGVTFTPARSDARFCSAACRQGAYRRRT